MISKHVDRHKAGVYMITNLINNKKYIGSSIEVYNRKHTHINKLRERKHSSKHLEAAYHKYGADNFLFEVLEYCDKENITLIEQHFIDEIKPEYNKREFAQNNVGNKPSEETREKIRNTLKEKYKNGLIAYDQKHRWKRVEQYDLQGNYIKTFSNPKDAELEIGCTLGKVSYSCNKDNSIVKNYQWKYEGDSDKIIYCYIGTSNKHRERIDLGKNHAQFKECELLEKPEVVNQQPRLDGNTSKVQRLGKVTFRAVLGTDYGKIPTSAFQLTTSL